MLCSYKELCVLKIWSCFQKRCAKSWWSSLVKLLWRSRRSIMRNQCKLTRCCLNCRTETVWKRWACFIKRAGTPFAFHLKAVAASVVSFAQQGLWDYAETWLWMKLPTKSYILCNKDAVSTVSLLWEWESRSLIHKFLKPCMIWPPRNCSGCPSDASPFRLSVSCRVFKNWQENIRKSIWPIPSTHLLTVWGKRSCQ